ncbi:MAG: hypothetical protein IKJ68_08895 [Clostridia bacterium]|nr:hypothetical protein [Clostridia bacterium]
MKKLLCVILSSAIVYSLSTTVLAKSKLMNFPTTVQLGNSNTNIEEMLKEVIKQAEEENSANIPSPEYAPSEDAKSGNVKSYSSLDDLIKIQSQINN